jgi:hypothetical protein
MEWDKSPSVGTDFRNRKSHVLLIRMSNTIELLVDVDVFPGGKAENIKERLLYCLMRSSIPPPYLLFRVVRRSIR